MKLVGLTAALAMVCSSTAFAQQSSSSAACLNSAGLPLSVPGNAYVVGCGNPNGQPTPVTGMVGGYVDQQLQSNLNAYASQIGRRSVDVGLIYENQSNWDMADASSQWTLDQMPAPQKLSLSVPLLTVSGGGTLADVAAGKYDSHFKLWAQRAAARDPAMIIRIGWEFNGNWMPWSMNGNGPGYVAAYRRVHDIFKAASANFQFDWCPNFAADDPTPGYPGDTYVDFIGQDVYQFGDTPGGDQGFKSMLTQKFGLLWHQQFAAQHNKPMSYPEIGSQPDDPAWVNDMVNWMKVNGVIYFCWWNVVVDVDSYLPNHPANMATMRTAWQSTTAQVTQMATKAVIDAVSRLSSATQSTATAAGTDPVQAVTGAIQQGQPLSPMSIPEIAAALANAPKITSTVPPVTMDQLQQVAANDAAAPPPVSVAALQEQIRQIQAGLASATDPAVQAAIAVDAAPPPPVSLQQIEAYLRVARTALAARSEDAVTGATTGAAGQQLESSIWNVRQAAREAREALARDSDPGLYQPKAAPLAATSTED